MTVTVVVVVVGSVVVVTVVVVASVVVGTVVVASVVVVAGVVVVVVVVQAGAVAGALLDGPTVSFTIAKIASPTMTAARTPAANIAHGVRYHGTGGSPPP